MFQNNSHCSWGARIWELNCSLARKPNCLHCFCLPPFMVVCIYHRIKELSRWDSTSKTKVLGKFLFNHKGEDAIACKTSNGNLSKLVRESTLHFYQHVWDTFESPQFLELCWKSGITFYWMLGSQMKWDHCPKGRKVANTRRRSLKDKQQYINLWVGTTVLATLMKDDVICACFILWDWAMRMLF